jgi:hypothetical protein
MYGVLPFSIFNALTSTNYDQQGSWQISQFFLHILIIIKKTKKNEGMEV